MATFQVPQFIDLEDKIVGPLSLRQFSFIATAFLISLGLFYILQFILWLIITVFLGSLSLGLAFARVGGRSLLAILISGLKFYWRPRRYLWQHEIPAPLKTAPPVVHELKLPAPSGRTRAKRVSIPQVAPLEPKIIVTEKPALAESQITTGAGLKSLSDKLSTTKSAIPKREKPFLWFRRGPREQFEVLEKSTGEHITARRIDYR